MGSVAARDCQSQTAQTSRIEAATAISVSGAGARTRLSVRPERLIIDPDETQAPNRYKARVVGMDFRGDHTLLHLRLASGTHLEAKIPNGRVEDGFGSDDEIEVGWQTRHCRALDPPG